MRRLFIAAAVGLLACTGTVSLGTVPSDDTAGDAAAASTTDAGSDAQLICSAGGASVVNDFEQGIVGTDPNTGGIYGTVSIDRTNPIDGTGSLAVAPSGAAYAFIDFLEEPALCRVDVSFKIRPSAELIANGASLVNVGLMSTLLGAFGGRSVLVTANPGGSIAVTQIMSNVSGETFIVAKTESIGQLTPNQVSALSFTADLAARSITLGIDGQTTSTTLATDDNTGGIAGLNVGSAEGLPPTTVGKFWLDDLSVTGN